MSVETDYLKKNLAKPITIIGMMGSGKTHAGRRLARILSLDFYDSDKVIEEKAGRSVAEIFEMYGEPKFRESEHRTILELLQRGPSVIATGGGSVVNPATMSAIKEQSHSVWLRAGLDEIVDRVGRDEGRPLLKAGDPRVILAGLMEQRQPYYSQADITVDTVAGSADEMAGAVIKALYACINPDKF